MIDVSIIILSKTTSLDSFNTTKNCLNSLFLSEDNVSMEVFIIESNKKFYSTNFNYHDKVKVIVPDAKFNFHKFLNIGIKKSSGKFIALCNNDIIFKKRWFSEILLLKKKHPNILSFSPIDFQNKLTPIEKYKDLKFEIGYQVRTHIAGWCIVFSNDLIKKIGYLDEQFSFYYADDDYAMNLRKHNIKHALVTTSEVTHLGGIATSESKKTSNNFNKNKINKKDYPKYLDKSKNKWILNNDKILEGHLLFHKKWGSQRVIAYKNRFVYILKKINLDLIIIYIY